MIRNTLIKILLAPFSLLYGLGVSLRDFFYRKELLKGIEFDLPIIAVGNLSIGGAGKTPHIEYLIRLLKDYLYIATLSRGYKRKSKGFLIVEPGLNAEIVGDEPLQFKRKFPEVLVTVCESRTFAIPKIVLKQPNTQLILLDDAFQHRSIKPGLNILLTQYRLPFTKDYLLPSGRLREWRSAYQRADIIIISKCPPQMQPEEHELWLAEIKPFEWQRLYFSYYQYQRPYHLLEPSREISLNTDLDVLLICAIAGTDYLVEYLDATVQHVKVIEYEDHHFFSKYDIGRLHQSFEQLESSNKIILTTEKDAMRLELHRSFLIKHQLPVYVLPIEVGFHFNQATTFDTDIKNFLLQFKS